MSDVITVLARSTLSLLLLGCVAEGAPAADAETVTAHEQQPTDSKFWTYFKKQGEISLEERDDVLTVEPVVVPDALGGLFVIEPKENQVRMYDTTGRLKGYFGRKGGGPGEMNLPSMARRLPNGSIVVTNVMDSRIQVYDRDGGKILQELRVQAYGISDILPVGDSWVVAAPSASTSAQLFLIDSGGVRASFMPQPSTEIARQSGSTFGFVTLAQRGDTIAALHALSDTVYLFDGSGRALGTFAMPFATENRPAKALSPSATPPELAAWAAGIRRNVRLFWLADGSFVVQTGRRSAARRLIWGLLHATRDGKAMFESASTPRLMTVIGPTFYFRDDSREEPNAWFTAQLSR